MLVKISIINPFTDQFVLRALKYKAIKTTKARKQRIPTNMLPKYSIGCLDISPNETIENQRETHTSPAAQIADVPKESADVLMVQLFITVLENIRQNKAQTINVIPNKISTKGQPFSMPKTTNSYEGLSAPPIIPTALF